MGLATKRVKYRTNGRPRTSEFFYRLYPKEIKEKVRFKKWAKPVRLEPTMKHKKKEEGEKRVYQMIAATPFL